MSDTVHYRTFSVGNEEYELDIVVDAVTSTVANGLAIAVQLDGNATQSSYELFLDRVNLITNEPISPLHPWFIYLPFITR